MRKRQKILVAQGFLAAFLFFEVSWQAAYGEKLPAMYIPAAEPRVHGVIAAGRRSLAASSRKKSRTPKVYLL